MVRGIAEGPQLGHHHAKRSQSLGQLCARHGFPARLNPPLASHSRLCSYASINVSDCSAVSRLLTQQSWEAAVTLAFFNQDMHFHRKKYNLFMFLWFIHESFLEWFIHSRKNIIYSCYSFIHKSYLMIYSLFIQPFFRIYSNIP